MTGQRVLDRLKFNFPVLTGTQERSQGNCFKTLSMHVSYCFLKLLSVSSTAAVNNLYVTY